MSALTLTLKIAPQQRIDMAALTPDALAGQSLAAIGDILLPYGKTRLRVADAFTLDGSDSGQIIIRNGHDKLDAVGARMRTGSITVEGNAGAYLGLQQRGGRITVKGSAGAFAACEMKGGEILIRGDAGDFLAGALPGSRKGMQGGLVIVGGNAGDRAADQMRRGIVLIEGNAGDYCAARMLAGTVGVLGTVGTHLGYGMRRGTVLLQSTPALHATLQDCGTHTLPFLSLMFKSFSGLPGRFATLDSSRARRYAGDLAVDGKGEILVLQ